MIIAGTLHSELHLISTLYLDVVKEQKRQDKIVEFQKTGKWPGMKEKPVKSEPWSKKKEERVIIKFL